MFVEPHRIDIHHHILPPEYLAALEKFGLRPPVTGSLQDQWTPSRSLEFMDRQGIAIAMTSITSSGVYFGDFAQARDLATLCNEFSARLVDKYPQRFGAFAILPLPDIDGALQELSYALDTLRLDGVILLTNSEGHYLGDPMFDPIFEELNRRKAVVFIHPTVPPNWQSYKPILPPFLFEFFFDITRTVATLVYSGAFERYPDIPFILSHAGGAIPYLVGRFLVGKEMLLQDFTRDAPKDIIGCIANLYYDISLSTMPHIFSTLQTFVSPQQLIYGSDYPFPPEHVIADIPQALRNYPNFNRRDCIAIEHMNSLRIFPRLHGNSHILDITNSYKEEKRKV